MEFSKVKSRCSYGWQEQLITHASTTFTKSGTLLWLRERDEESNGKLFSIHSDRSVNLLFGMLLSFPLAFIFLYFSSLLRPRCDGVVVVAVAFSFSLWADATFSLRFAILRSEDREKTPRDSETETRFSSLVWTVRGRPRQRNVNASKSEAEQRRTLLDPYQSGIDQRRKEERRALSTLPARSSSNLLIDILSLFLSLEER